MKWSVLTLAKAENPLYTIVMYVLGVSAYSILVMSLKGGLHNFVKTHLLRKSKMRAW